MGRSAIRLGARDPAGLGAPAFGHAEDKTGFVSVHDRLNTIRGPRQLF